MLPNGGTVSVNDGKGGTTTIDIPTSGGTVKPGGDVTGENLKVNNTTVTVTNPENGTVTADKNGDVTVPSGTT